MIGGSPIGYLALGELESDGSSTYSLFANTSSYVLTLTTTGLNRTFPLPAAVTSYTLTLNGALLTYNRPFAAETTSFTLSLVAPAIYATYRLPVTVTGYTLTLVSADVFRTDINPIEASTSAYVLTLNNLSFTVTSGRKFLRGQVGKPDNRRLAA